MKSHRSRSAQRPFSIKFSLVSFLIVLAGVAAVLPVRGTTFAQTPPGNDNFAAATAISGTSGSVSGTTIDATAQTGDPAFHTSYNWDWIPTDDLGGHSVWYVWTAPAGIGPTTFIVVGRDYYYSVPVLGVYTGSPGALAEVGYNERSQVDGTWQRAHVSFAPVAGVTYHIGIGAFKGDEVGSFDLSWAPSNPPVNDNFADAPPLPTEATGSTVEATSEAGEPANYYQNSDLGGRSVWYTYTPTQSAVTVISLEGSSYYAALGVYTGSLGSLTEVAYDDGNDSRISFIAEAGTTYHIGIGGYNGLTLDGGQVMFWGYSGAYKLHVLPGASNDDFANATAISGASGEQSAWTDASPEAGDPARHTSYNGDLWPDDFYGRAIWYAWTAPESAAPTTFAVTSPSSYDLSLGVYTGSLGSFTEVVYNQTAPYATADVSGERAQVDFVPEPGATYYVAVGSEHEALQIDLTWGPSADAPANDDFANASPLAAEVSGNTLGATLEAGEPTGQTGSWGPSSSDLGGRSVWYVYTPETSGTVDISLEGSNYYAIVGVYTGTLGSLTEVVWNDADPDSVTLTAEAGVTYYIGVGGGWGLWLDGGQVMEWGESGTYLLHATGPGLAAYNDNFANARAISGAAGSQTGSTLNATGESSDPNLHASYTGSVNDLYGGSIWYSWTAPDEVGPTTFALLNNSWNSPNALGIYTGSLGSLTEVAYNVRSPNNDYWYEWSQVQFTPAAGVTYYIGVGSQDPSGITLSWAPSEFPANDNFADAVPLPVEASGSTVEATFEPGEPTFRGNSDLGGRSVWYTYTATEPTAVDITLDGSSFHTVLGVYTGDLGSLTEVAFRYSGNGVWSSVSFIAEAGITYHIGIGGSGANNYVVDGGQTVTWGRSGNYSLHATTAPAAAPAVTADPLSQTVNAGQVVTFTAAASGAPAPTVHWEVSMDGVNWTDMTGETSATLDFAAQAADNGKQYHAVFTNLLGSAASDPATLTVQWAPSVTTHPVSQTVFAGQTATFTAAASGNPSPTVHWEVSSNGSDWADLPGATSETLSFTAQAADDGKQYRAVFTNALGSATSNATTLTISVAPAAPVIIDQPDSQTVVVGQTATFTVAASGNPAPTVQWQLSTSGGRRWTNIPGATDTTLTLTGVTYAQNGYQYRTVFTNSEGSATSNAATLTVIMGDADVSIAYTSGVYDSLAGTVTWVLSVTNDGPDAAQDVQVTDVVARGTKLVSVNVEGAPGWTSKAKGAKLGINLGVLSNGASATITIVSQLGRTALPVANSATVATASNDADAADNTSSYTVNGP